MGHATRFIQRYLRNNQNRHLAQKLYKLSRKFCEGYENLNFDSATNGEFRVIRSLRSPKVIYDVGANIGEWAALAAQCHPRATIHCFEPIEANCKVIQSRQLSNVIVNPFGLLDDTKEVTFNLYTSCGHGSIFDWQGHKEPSNHRSIPVVRGDDYLRNGTVDYLKIDVEGADFLVIQGFERALRERRIKQIQFEYGECNIHSKFLLHDFYRFFRRMGYKVGKIFPRFVDFRELKPSHENFIGSNYLAVLP